MRVKVKDIAKALGLSPTTVSLVLNDKPSRISEDTKRKIFAIAQEMQYKERKSSVEEKIKAKIIGVIIPNSENMFYQKCLKRIEDVLNNYDYGVFRYDVSDSPEKCFKAIENLNSRLVDGIIIIPPNNINTEEHYEKMLSYFNNAKIPMILFDRAVYSVFCDFITGDNKYGAHIGTEYLIQNGHKKIGLIVGEKSAYITRKRIQGYRETLEDNYIEFDESLIIYGDFKEESGKLAAKELIEKGVTAIFAGNDLMAYGIYKYAKKEGISIPEDLSIIGYDNTEICNMLSFRLTTIDQNAENMGEKAADVMIGHFKKKKYEKDQTKPRTYYFTPFLVEGESVKKIN